MKEVNIIELFAGVGGFRVGLERADANFFKTIWANQWEPSTKIQHAAIVYSERFGKDSISNKDINTVNTIDIPDHDMMVGGFPCQDYSVATTLNNSKGIEGKKGVLWWSIYRILKEKGDKRPMIVFLENVDRLLISPANQRGRDFAIILECFNELGYIVEWRIINAAEYAMPQRRRRTYILAYKQDSPIFNYCNNPSELIMNSGVFAKSFPVVKSESLPIVKSIILSKEKRDRLLDITHNFNINKASKPFENSGVMINGIAHTFTTISNCTEQPLTLRDIIVKGDDKQYITDDFYIPAFQIDKWKYFKESKREERINKEGFKYFYSEGGMEFPDSLDKPSRTIITSEGGKSPDRCRHVIKDDSGRLRRLIPLELERLNMFPDHHTQVIGVDNGKRAFLMGNALVCGVITKVGNELKMRLQD